MPSSKEDDEIVMFPSHGLLQKHMSLSKEADVRFC